MGPFYPIGVDYRGHGPAFAVAFLLPFIGGIALDVQLHTVPFFTTLGSIVGVLAFVAVLLFYRKTSESKAQDSARPIRLSRDPTEWCPISHFHISQLRQDWTR